MKCFGGAKGWGSHLLACLKMGMQMFIAMLTIFHKFLLSKRYEGKKFIIAHPIRNLWTSEIRPLCIATKFFQKDKVCFMIIQSRPLFTRSLLKMVHATADIYIVKHVPIILKYFHLLSYRYE